MSILNSVLMYCKPSQWEDASYSGKLYYLFDLQPGDEEYIDEVDAFQYGSPRLNVVSLQRYQNPTFLGRLKVRKEHLRFRHEIVEEVKYYHPIAKRDLQIALEFNMDVRRYSHTSGCTSNDKDPKFYKTPGAAYNAVLGVSEKVILICKLLGKSYEGNTCYKSNEAEFMPIYVAEVQ